MISVPFTVLSTQRSGSTWVVDQLNSHPRIRAYSELFLENGKGIPMWGGRKDFLFYEDFRERARGGTTVGTYLDELYEYRTDVSAIGFKLMYCQLSAFPEFMPYFIGNRVSIVHLVRTNLLDVLISRYTAQERMQYHAKSDDRVSQVSIKLNLSTLLSELRRLDCDVKIARKCIRESGMRGLEVVYENLRHDVNAFKPVLAFLGVDKDYKLSSSLIRINRVPRAELVTNFDEVCRLLGSSPYGYCLSGDVS